MKASTSFAQPGKWFNRASFQPLLIFATILVNFYYFQDHKDKKSFPDHLKGGQMSVSSLLDAVRVVKENERIAESSYADAAREIRNPVGKELFTELSKFENYHYEKLTALEMSLEKTGKFIQYQGKEFPTPPVFEIRAAQEPNTKSVMTIITGAIDLEKQAEKAYADLAVMVTDQNGHDMFRRLAEEEHIHHHILLDAFWTLTNLGVWKWSHP